MKETYKCDQVPRPSVGDKCFETSAIKHLDHLWATNVPKILKIRDLLMTWREQM